ncbi:hypothetical protein MJO28_004601 [Puccinia striiformis f. sp. tritici]|uniref:Uncharacterized protein n=1 Tax=Puccinia striiformis f. sp. tritici TaxID=168172 RepID=A0ACC0EPX6_9BASI|nr:hypothetical protein MJO28_004601 [Puccinia striiformis f. sp. tritici]
MAGRTRTQASGSGTLPADNPSTSTLTKKEDKEKIKCPTFNGENFPIWRKKMIVYLRYLELNHCIENPLPEEPTDLETKQYLEVAAILGSHVADDIYNHIITDENLADAHAIWKELQTTYAAATILAIFHVWTAWEDVQYNKGMLQYITDMESVLARFSAMGLDLPGHILSCGIIARITKKRPVLMETLLSSTTMLENPKLLIRKLRDIANHDSVTERPQPNIPSTSTALATNPQPYQALATNAQPYHGSRGRPHKRRLPQCRNGVHNQETNHVPEECWALNPDKDPRPKRTSSGYVTTVVNPSAASSSSAPTSQVQVRPSFSYITGVSDDNSQSKIVLDSGASHHMLNNLSMFKATSLTSISIVTGNKDDRKELVAIARGPAVLRFNDGNVLELSDALYVPNLTRNLVSLVQLMQHKVVVTGGEHGYTVQIDDGHSLPVDTSNYILELNGVIQPPVIALAHSATATSIAQPSELQRWHNRLGHASRARIQVALKGALLPAPTVTCSACMTGKLTKLAFKSHFRPASAPLEIIHGDLVGPISPATNGGARYFLTLVDQYSGHIHTSVLKLKSDALEAIKAYKLYFERQTGHTIKKLITDGGGEFVNKALSGILAAEGIQHNVSPPYTPQHNGFAERANRTIIDMTRTMMMQANLAPEWWGEAVKTATATTNCLPSLSKSKMSPVELLFRTAPNMATFRPFGCRAWIVKPKQARDTKFGALSWEGILLGYENDFSAYKLLQLEDKAIITSKHAHFDESHFPPCPALNRSHNAYGINKLPSFVPSDPLPFSEEDELNAEAARMEVDEEDHLEVQEMQSILHRLSSAEPDTPSPEEDTEGVPDGQPVDADPNSALPARRLILHPPRHPTLISSDIDSANIRHYKRRQAFVATLILDPKNHKQAMSSPRSADWKEAELKEIANMILHEVWVKRARRPDDAPIPAIWAYRTKLGPENQILEFKARICAQGFRQTYGLNFLVKYAPTGRPASLHIILSFAVDNGLAIHQLDVRSAFLTCPLDDTVTLLPPPGFDCPPNTVLELKKAIYGLRQAPLVWYKRLTNYLKSLGFTVSESDPCVFYRVKVPGREDTIIFGHVDDLVIVSKRPQCFRAEMEAEFKIKYPGDAVFLLGMNIERSEHGISINQTQYIERKLVEFGLDTHPPASCPLNPKAYLKKATPSEVAEFSHLGVNYRSLVGSLNYLSVLTRPDISYAVSTLSQYLDHPGITHYQAAVQVFRYLSSTRSLGLNFFKNAMPTINAFVDADWGNCPDTRRSSTGFVILAGTHLIAWKSSKQPTISLSTSEAEYKALSDLGRELAWLVSLIKESGVNPQTDQIVVRVDNRGAIDLANSETSQNGFRTKHMDIRLHFVRELLAIGLLKLVYVVSAGNVADFLTKPTGRSTIRKSLIAVGVLQASEAALHLATQGTGGCQTFSLSARSKRRRAGRKRAGELAPKLEATKSHQDGPPVNQTAKTLAHRIVDPKVEAIRKLASRITDALVADISNVGTNEDEAGA